jgi:small GTP-binding protein
MYSIIKCIAVGDAGVGKTSALQTYASNRFDSDAPATAFENYDTNIVVDGKLLQLSVWDTAGQDEYEKLRCLCYEGTNVVLLYFSVGDRQSYERIQSKWIAEIRRFCPPQVPVLLVATKTDLRRVHPLSDDFVATASTEVETKQLAQSVEAADWCECSAITLSGLHEMFEKMVRLYWHNGVTGAVTDTSDSQHRRSKNSCIASTLKLQGVDYNINNSTSSHRRRGETSLVKFCSCVIL